MYSAFVIVKARSTHRYQSIHDVVGLRLAVNHLNSFSGSVSLKLALLAAGGDNRPKPDKGFTRIFFHPDITVTGSHRESVRAVATSPHVDVAAIDCITFDLLKRTCPSEVADVAIIAQTAPAPAPPIVVPAPFMRNGVGDMLRVALKTTLQGKTNSPEVDVVALRSALRGLRITEFQSRSQMHSLYETTYHRAKRRVASVVFRVWPSNPVTALSYHDKLDASHYHCAGWTDRICMCVCACLSVCIYISIHLCVHVISATATPRARRWLDRGMLLAFAFNHAESRWCFEQAIAADSDCALAHWGVAYVSGVYYNNPFVEPEVMQREQALT